MTNKKKRKSSIISLLNNLNEELPSIQSSSGTHSHRNRSIASIVNEETVLSNRLSNNIRKKSFVIIPIAMVNWWILAQKNFINPHIKNIRVHKVQFGLIFSNLMKAHFRLDDH